jgi:predicted transcriptional regulator YheO
MTKEAEKKAILAESYYKQGDMAVNKIASEIGVSKMTLYKYLRYRKVEIGSYVHQNDSKKASNLKSVSYIL